MNGHHRVLLFAVAYRHRILLVCCVAAAALVLSAPFPAHLPVVAVYAAGVAAAALAAALVDLAIRLACRRIDRLLYARLDPAAFGQAYHSLYSRLKNKAAPAAVHFLMNISLGMIETGRPQDAAALLSRMGRFKSRAGKRGLLRFYTQLARAQIESGALAKAGVTLDITERLLTHLRPGVRDHRRCAFRHTQNHMRLSLARGQAGEAAAVFCEAFEEARSEYARVLAREALGRAYHLQGEPEKARQALEYAAEHGNRLHAAGRARALLAELPPPG